MTDAEQRLSEVGGTPTCKQTNTFFKKTQACSISIWIPKKKKDYQLTKSYVEKQEHNGSVVHLKKKKRDKNLVEVHWQKWKKGVGRHRFYSTKAIRNFFS